MYQEWCRFEFLAPIPVWRIHWDLDLDFDSVAILGHTWPRLWVPCCLWLEVWLASGALLKRESVPSHVAVVSTVLPPVPLLVLLDMPHDLLVQRSWPAFRWHCHMQVPCTNRQDDHLYRSDSFGFLSSRTNIQYRLDRNCVCTSETRTRRSGWNRLHNRTRSKLGSGCL